MPNPCGAVAEQSAGGPASVSCETPFSSGVRVMRRPAARAPPREASRETSLTPPGTERGADVPLAATARRSPSRGPAALTLF